MYKRQLINAVIKNATVPVIQTGEGNCHVYVDRFADIDMVVLRISSSNSVISSFGTTSYSVGA